MFYTCCTFILFSCGCTISLQLNVLSPGVAAMVVAALVIKALPVAAIVIAAFVVAIIIETGVSILRVYNSSFFAPVTHLCLETIYPKMLILEIKVCQAL